MIHKHQTTADLERPALYFTGLLLMSALMLQRFGPTIGSSYLCVVGPIGLLLAGFGLLQGALAFSRARLTLFIALIGSILLGGAMRAAVPDYYGTPASWLSLVQFMALTFFGAFAFARPVSETRFFRVVNGCFLFVAIAGALQFLLQFVGLSLFTFTEFIPSNWLLEGPYMTVISIADSGFLKSNGLFLVEPSVFSQYMGLAIIIEILAFRRIGYLLVFAAGLMCSISGTGWLVIITFVITASLSLGARGVLLALMTALIAIFALAGLAVFFPAGYDFFISRTGEFSAMGSSAHQRFVTPWWLANYVFSRTPWVGLYGLGAGVSEHLGMQPAWDYNTNPPVKISLEYGLPCFVLYVLFLVKAHRTSVQKALFIPVLELLMFDGGSSQFAPILFPSMLLITVANLEAGPTGFQQQSTT